VLVQIGAGGGDRLDDTLLTRNEVGAHPRDQPHASAPEQSDPVEAEVNGFSPTDGGQRIGDRAQVPPAQHRIRHVRDMPAVGVGAQARHALRLDPVPERPDRPLGSPVEQ
jgi:hypothetical protein